MALSGTKGQDGDSKKEQGDGDFQARMIPRLSHGNRGLDHSPQEAKAQNDPDDNPSKTLCQPPRENRKDYIGNDEYEVQQDPTSFPHLKIATVLRDHS